MKNEALLIKASGEVTPLVPENGKSFQLKECYKLINCDLIQVVELHDGRLMICDEESKLHAEAHINKEATKLYMMNRLSHKEYISGMRAQGIDVIDLAFDDEVLNDSICGDVIVCSPKMFE